MWYLLWRVLTGRHRSITLSFLLTGHTKFSPDWCFGILKILFRRSEVNCLADIAKVAEDSSYVNSAQLCGKENGEIIVPIYDWTKYLAVFLKKLTAIKTYHHFLFRENSLGVNIKEYSDTEAIDQLLLKGDLPPVDGMPAQIQPKGLDAKRKWYLFEEIRPFISEECRDLPDIPKPTRAGVIGDENIDSSDNDDAFVAPPTKHGRGQSRGVRRGCTVVQAEDSVQAEDVSIQIRYVFNNNCLF